MLVRRGFDHGRFGVGWLGRLCFLHWRLVGRVWWTWRGKRRSFWSIGVRLNEFSQGSLNGSKSLGIRSYLNGFSMESCADILSIGERDFGKDGIFNPDWYSVFNAVIAANEKCGVISGDVAIHQNHYGHVRWRVLLIYCVYVDYSSEGYILSNNDPCGTKIGGNWPTALYCKWFSSWCYVLCGCNICQVLI